MKKYIYSDQLKTAESGDPAAMLNLWILLELAAVNPFRGLDDAEFERKLEEVLRTQSLENPAHGLKFTQQYIAEAREFREFSKAMTDADIEQRHRWLERASDMGDMRAQAAKLRHIFVESFSNPTTVVNDETRQLAQMVERAAIDGKNDEFTNLSSYYEAGNVVVPDPIKSYAYMAISVEIARRMGANRNFLAAGESNLANKASRLGAAQLKQAEALKQKILDRQQRSS